jgi:hypothetical protein
MSLRHGTRLLVCTRIALSFYWPVLVKGQFSQKFDCFHFETGGVAPPILVPCRTQVCVAILRAPAVLVLPLLASCLSFYPAF